MQGARDIIAMAEAVAGDEEALDAIRQAGPGGSYLDTEHTAQHFREFWRPRWFDHQSYAGWEAAGSRSCEERMRAAVRRILAEHKVEPLPAQIVAKLDAVVAARG